MAVGAVTEVKRVPLMLRVPPELRRRAHVDAARHELSMNDHLAAILDQHLPSAEAPTAEAT